MPPSAHTAAMKMTRLQSGALGVLSELTSLRMALTDGMPWLAKRHFWAVWVAKA
jgi:hypothetical protein